MLGLAAGIAPAQAAELSNDASGIAVRKLGTATVSAAELLAVEQRRNGETKGKGEPA
jgi:bifunctional ADP-heptose synthase (sugar kinase/adenylyltransferase)